MTDEHAPPLCDYEGSDYRERFWQDQGRDYEDQVERIALRRLLPPTGETLIDIGAGFGRLAREYDGYQKVVLFDYSRSLLRQAQEQLAHDPRFLFVAGNWYEMPFVSGLFETMVQVRTLHHAADPPTLFAELKRIARPGGCYILEFANKRNLKAIARYLFRRQRWRPFDLQPIEFVELNFDFHPAWIREKLRKAGFTPEATLTVSHFRLPLLKQLVPTAFLARLDSVLQHTGRWWQYTPSVFLASDHGPEGEPAAAGAFFACPRCKTPLPQAKNAQLPCPGCALIWRVKDGLYDFKEPRNERSVSS